jgi:two-component system cell cycle response regulator
MEPQNRILIAEDDQTTRTILAGILKKWGFAPQVVKDGLAAWNVLKEPDAPHLVILDWMMPGMDGVDVIKKVRAEENGQPPYIILLTSKDSKGDILAGLESGANDYIKKPFDHEELYARIRAGQRTVELQTRVFEIQQTLAHQATHDPLTGILNRRAILDVLSKEMARAQRTCLRKDFSEELRNLKLSIGFFDVDHFKQINDRFGHQAGDEVLKKIVDVVSSQLREYDAFGRMGGDEFLVVAPDTDFQQSQAIFGRLMDAVANCRINTADGDIAVTLSLGVTYSNPDIEWDQLLETADAAMYRAKNAGGNGVTYQE